MGDFIHVDNTGHGGSVAWRQQRDRAAAMRESWAEGVLGGEDPPSEERAERSMGRHTLRAQSQGWNAPKDQQERIARHIDKYGPDPT